MRKISITTEQVARSLKYCDVCGKEIKKGMACMKAKCEMCGKDLCEDCIGHEDDTMGDYREVYCGRCWDTGAKFRKEIELHEFVIGKLHKQWRDKCNENKKS